MSRRAYRTDNRDDGFSEQTGETPPTTGFAKRDLLAVCELSGKTFDMFRKAARVKGPSHGGLSHIFSAEDVIAIIHKCEGGNFTERGGEPAAAWRKLLADSGIKVPNKDDKKRSGPGRGSART